MSPDSQHSVSLHFVACVRELIALRKVSSARQMALSLDYKPQGLSEILLGKRNVPVDLLKRAVDMYLLNPRYLFTGEGEMFELQGNLRKALTHVVVVDPFQRERIVHVPVVAHAGYKDNLSEPVFVQDLPTYALPENILREGSYRSFEVAGDSMEPTLIAGDKVIGAMVEPQYWEQGIKDNAVHVLITYHDVLVKRVLNFISEQGMLELHSDNPFHQPFHIPIEDLREAWIVRLRITGNLSRPTIPGPGALLDDDSEEVEMDAEMFKTLASLTNPDRIR